MTYLAYAEACRNGHPRTPENTATYKGWRRCLDCEGARYKRRDDAAKALRGGRFSLTANDLLAIDSGRFWSRVDKAEGCWLWTGNVAGTSGYGSCYVPHARTTTAAHRVAWALSGRALVQGMELDHLCRNRMCVNPDHLEQVSSQVNNARSTSVTARNGRKTRCIRGHEFTPENTYTPPSGGRYCRECRRSADRRRRA